MFSGARERAIIRDKRIFQSTICNIPGISPPVTDHRILTHQPSPEAEIDTPAMAASAAFIEGREEDLAMLTRAARITMELMEAQNDYARSRLAAAAGEGGPLKPGEDPTAPLNKLVQTLRRTLALKKMSAEDLERRRAGLVTERAARRQQRSEDHKTSVNNEIDDALTDAFTVMYGDGDAETDKRDALCREMLADKENLFVDSEVFNDYLTRPVGETVTLLCVALGLPADTCIRQGDTWLVKRPPGAYETFRESRAAELNRPPATASSP
jgi:hypothetical protein